MLVGKVLMAINRVKAKGELCQVGVPKAVPGELKAEGPEPKRLAQPQLRPQPPQWPGIPVCWQQQPDTRPGPEPGPW